MQNEKIVLTISLLASRNADDVRKCLCSLKPIRDAIPCEVIAVDTSGGDEGLINVLCEYADEIVKFTWCDDFAKARNAGLERAKGEWFLYLDDDEWFVEMEPLIRFFKSGNYRRYNGANYLVRNFSNMEGTAWTDAWVTRLVQIRPETHFVSKIHEYITPMPDKFVGLKAIAYHFGYVYKSDEDQRKHFERNSALLLKMLREEPDNVRWWKQMLMEYASVCEWQKLYDFADEYMAYFADRHGVDEDGAWGSCYAAKTMALEKMKEIDVAYQQCLIALEDKRITPLAQAYVSLYKGDYGIQLGKYAEAESGIKEYLKWKQYFEKNERLFMIQSSTPFVGDIFESRAIAQAYSVLICAGLKQKKLIYLKQYFNRLGYDKTNVYLYSYMMECLIEAMATMKEEKIFLTVLKTMYGHEELWRILQLGLLKWVMEEREGSLHLIALLRKAEVDDSFLKVYYLRNQVCHFPEEKTDEELQALLEQYVTQAKTYFEESYGEKMAGGQTEELSPDCRAVLLLQKLFGRVPLEEKLAVVRQVVEAYPPFAETMKRYVRVLQKKEGQQTDPQTAFKLQLMAQQVMKQISVLLEAGQTEEARGIVLQLREMLPENEQIRNLEKQILEMQVS